MHMKLSLQGYEDVAILFCTKSHSKGDKRVLFQACTLFSPNFGVFRKVGDNTSARPSSVPPCPRRPDAWGNKFMNWR